jgi:hypothetical protein
MSEDRRQMPENREPQNIEGKENFIIRNSLFDIQNRGWSLAAGFWQPQRTALRSGFHLSSDFCPLPSVKGVLRP